MRAETYRGRTLMVRRGRGAQWATMHAWVNGEPVAVVEKFDEDAALAELRRDIDNVDTFGIDGDRFAPHWYTPGTYERCQAGHAVAPGEQCRHQWCAQHSRGQPQPSPDTAARLPATDEEGN